MDYHKDDKKFETALSYLEGEKASKKENSAAVKSSIAIVRQYAESRGLHQEAIIRLIKVTGSEKLNSLLLSTLIRSLIPRENIPEEAILCTISKMCAGKYTLRIQELLLRWIVLVFDIISSKSKLHCLYGIFFHYIYYDTLAPYVCQILFLLTRQQDVTHYRIASLLKHQKKIGNQPHICALLSAYRLYQPNLIVMSAQARTQFKRRDKLWQKSIYSIISRYGPVTDQFFSVPRSHSKAKSLLPEAKRCTINDTQVDMDKPISSLVTGKVNINEVKSMDDLLRSVGNLHMPGQAASLLSSRLLQHVLVVSPDASLIDRLSIWLNHNLLEGLFEEPQTSKGGELLDIIVSFTDMFQVHLPVCESFLYRYLATWNGRDHIDLILKLITKLPIVDFEVLEDYVLNILRKLFTLAPNVQYRCKIVNTLMGLVRNYISVEMPRYKKALDAQATFTDLNSTTERLDVTDIIENLVGFADTLISEGLLLERGMEFVYCSGEFWRSVTSAIASARCGIFVVPRFAVIYRSLFSNSWVCISNACSTLRNLAQICISLDKKVFAQHGKAAKLLNQYLLDFHDTLWRHKAFHPHCSKNSIAYKGLEAPLVASLASHPIALPVSSMFSIDKHPALIISTALYLEKIEMESFDALDSEFVIDPDYMKHLQREGLTEIVELLKELTSPK